MTYILLMGYGGMRGGDGAQWFGTPLNGHYTWSVYYLKTSRGSSKTTIKNLRSKLQKLTPFLAFFLRLVKFPLNKLGNQIVIIDYQSVISKKVDFLCFCVLALAFLSSMKSFLESMIVFKGQTYPLHKTVPFVF